MPLGISVIVGLVAFGLRSASNVVRLVIAVATVLRFAGAIYVILPTRVAGSKV